MNHQTGPSRRVRPLRGVAHNHSPGYSQPRETVWKIAEGLLARLSGGKKRPNQNSFDPSWQLSELSFGTYPEFPNSFGRGILRSLGIRRAGVHKPRPFAPESSASVLRRWLTVCSPPSGCRCCPARSRRSERTTTHRHVGLDKKVPSHGSSAKGGSQKVSLYHALPRQFYIHSYPWRLRWLCTEYLLVSLLRRC